MSADTANDRLTGPPRGGRPVPARRGTARFLARLLVCLVLGWWRAADGAPGPGTGLAPAPVGAPALDLPLSPADVDPPSLPVPVADTTPAVRDVRADATGVEFLFEPGTPERRPAEDALGEAATLRFARLEAEGISLEAGPGAPEVPLVSRRLLVPPGLAWRLSFSIEGESRLDALRLPRFPLPLRRPDARGPLVPAEPADYPPPAVGEWPEAPVRAAEETLRGQRLLILSLAPFQYDATRGSARVFTRLHVRVDFVPGAGAPSPAADAARRGLVPGAGADPLLEAGLAGLVLNPGAPRAELRAGAAPTPAVAAAAAAPAVGITPGVPAEYFGTTATWLKLRVRRNGLYRVTGQALQSAGVTLSAIDPATLRVFAGGGRDLPETPPVTEAPDWNQPGGFGEVACRVEAGADGRFDAGDALVFYGLAVDNFLSWYQPGVLTDRWVENENNETNVYWVTWGPGFAAAPQRMAEQAVAPDPTDATERDVMPERRHFEVNDPGLYDPLPRERNVRWERWWWQLFDDSSAGTFWDLVLPDVDTTRPASFVGRWWGANTPRRGEGDPAGGTHFLSVTLNGGAPVNAQWSALNHYDTVIPEFTPAATTRVVATVPHLASDGNRIDQVLLAWFEVSYARKLRLPATGEEAGRLWWSGPRTDRAIPAPAQFRVALEGAATPEVYDVSDARAPVRLVGVEAANRGGARSVAFRVEDMNNRRWLAITPDGYQAPESIERDLRPTRWLRDPANAADYLVVAFDDFLPAAQTLAEWRRTHLRGITDGPAGRPANVAVVRVSDVFDEFSGGLVDPTAIRNFVQYASLAWTGGGSAPPPAYLVLLGDASRDTRDREKTGVRNLVPTWENGYDWPMAQPENSAQFATDDFFVRLQGPGDRIADLVVGRIPAVTPEMARQIVEGKILHAERPAVGNAERCRAILTSDDACQAGHVDSFSHLIQSEELDRVLPPVIDRRKINLYDYGTDCSILFKPAARRDLLTEMNRGSWLVNFVGHGSDQQIYDEKILEVADVATLDNLDALPVLIAASCSVGKFDRANSEGLAEALVKAPNGGGLATIAGTHLTYISDNNPLNVALLQELFPAGNPGAATLGLALWRAKNAVTQATACYSDSAVCDRQRKYLLLGDPASPTILPARGIRLTSAPDSLRRGATVRVEGEVLAADGVSRDESFDGVMQLRVEDHPEVKLAGTSNFYTLPGARLFEGEAPVVAGRFSASFVVPVSLRGGDNGRLRVYASSRGTPVAEAFGGRAPLTVGGAVQGTPDTEPPLITLTLPSGRAQPGQPLRVAIADTSGINLTHLFDFRSVLLAIEDDAGRERFRRDLTDGFAYDSGSHTRGGVLTELPALPAGRYTARVTATDNFNNRGEGQLALSIGAAGGGPALRDLFNHPNPFAASTRIYFTAATAGTARVHVYSVSGRRVWQRELAAAAGQNMVEWDGRDGEGDAVANGVYLVRVQLRPADGGRAVDALERVVRIR